jgi:hypothetical protein
MSLDLVGHSCNQMLSVSLSMLLLCADEFALCPVLQETQDVTFVWEIGQRKLTLQCLTGTDELLLFVLAAS